MITTHPNAAILRAIADGKDVQYRAAASLQDEWLDWRDGNSWACPADRRGNYIWRIKPNTININGHAVPEPLRTRPTKGESYWYVATAAAGALAYKAAWGVTETSEVRFLRGLCHATEEAARAHAEALISFTKLEG